MVLKEKFGLINVYIYKTIRHVILKVYICTYGFERKKIGYLTQIHPYYNQ